jgi:hypothetical protein
MPAVLRNVLAVVAGAVIGSVVNMGLVMLGPHVIPPPPGADVTTMEGLTRSLPLFGPQHFLFPFLAHAIGTLVGAAVAARIAVTRKTTVAFVVGALFLAGGVANARMLPGPLWFDVVDIVFAYLPMAWLGARTGPRRR